MLECDTFYFSFSRWFGVWKQIKTHQPSVGSWFIFNQEKSLGAATVKNVDCYWYRSQQKTREKIVTEGGEHAWCALGGEHRKPRPWRTWWRPSPSIVVNNAAIGEWTSLPTFASVPGNIIQPAWRLHRYVLHGRSACSSWVSINVTSQQGFNGPSWNETSVRRLLQLPRTDTREQQRNTRTIQWVRISPRM